jgi:hypothetical protein
MTRLFKIGVSLAAVVGFLSSPFGAHGQALRGGGPAQMRVEVDNPSMLVLRVVLGPHEKTGMHDVSSRLVIWLTEAHLRDANADGSVREYDRAPGAVEWVPAQRHAGENLSGKPVEFLAVVPRTDASVAPMLRDHEHQ